MAREPVMLYQHFRSHKTKKLILESLNNVFKTLRALIRFWKTANFMTFSDKKKVVLFALHSMVMLLVYCWSVMSYTSYKPATISQNTNTSDSVFFSIKNSLDQL